MNDRILELEDEVRRLQAINQALVTTITPRFGVILADPPWPFYSNNRQHGNYPLLPVAEIKGLGVARYAEDNCALFLWVTWPFLQEGLDVIKAWGFRYVTNAWTWVKKSKTNKAWHFGQGYYTRSNTEICLLGIKGKMKPTNRAVSNVLIAPITNHSRKPTQQYANIQALFPKAKKLELFARERQDGWHSWGNEVPSDVKLF